MIRNSLLIILILKLGTAFAQDSLYYITPDATIDQAPIDVKLNQPFIIKLRSCHDCGCHWNIEKYDTVNVKLITVRSKNVNGKEDWIGGEVFEFWKFIGVQVGTYYLEFVQKGPGRDPKEYGRFKFELWVN